MEHQIELILKKHLKNVPDEGIQRKNVENWDSITHLRLMMDFSEYLKIKLTPEIVETINSVGDLKNWINDVKG